MAGLVPFNRNKIFKPAGFEDFYNMLDDFFHDPWFQRRSFIHDTFKVDVQDKDREYYIEAEIPCVKKYDVHLDLNDGRLLIAVNRQENVEQAKRNYIHKERYYSPMRRSLCLPDAKQDGITAY